MSLRNDAKFEEKLTCGSEKDMRKMGKFLLEHSKVSKFGTLMGSFYPKQKMLGPKAYRGVMCGDNEE